MTSVLVAFSACSSGTASPSDSGSSVPSHAIVVVASTNVYGDIAQTVGGDAVHVTSIISDPTQDPHSYEANTQVALQLSKAKLVIENGGGYDDFVDTMLRSTKNQPAVVNAVEVTGLRPAAGEQLNEHVWYSLSSVQQVATRVARELATIDPSRASTFTANASTFNAGVDKLLSAQAQNKERYAGAGVAITEPVPLYLLEAAGLQNMTPEEFSEAIEEGEDVPTAVLKRTLDLFAERQVKALVYNEQTSGPVTEQVTSAAERAGIAVMPVTETLPQGQTYLTWMRSNISRLGQALGKS
ncbi:MAG TPA: zinc ABC transporter substrate-binding protein [Propionibacteriaceae bacterium]|nr:zinc ABC transporter substrate-binding protein [Propionibacteriaceae bacterium]